MEVVYATIWQEQEQEQDAGAVSRSTILFQGPNRWMGQPAPRDLG